MPDRPDPKGLPVLTVLMALLVLRDPLDLPGRKDLPEPTAPMVLLVLRDPLDLSDLKAPRVIPDPQDRKGLPAPMVLTVPSGHKDPPGSGCKAPQTMGMVLLPLPTPMAVRLPPRLFQAQTPTWLPII